MSDVPHSHGPGENCAACGHDHSDVNTPATARLVVTGLLFLINSWICSALFRDNPLLAESSAAVAALILLTPILRSAFRELRKGRLQVDALVAIGSLAAFTAADFQTAALVAFLMLLALIIESRSAAGAHKAVESLIRMAPDRARLVGADGVESDVSVSSLRPGDRVRVRPGENIPVDGEIKNGASTVNESTITGESLPRDRAIGDAVFAGTENLTGALDIAVTRVGADTTLGQVRNLILAAERTRLPVMRMMDHYAGYYTPFVLALGLLVWFFTGDWSRVVSILVVSCPCAVVLAAPTAMVAALSAAARSGILVKHIADLEAFARVSAVVFDKTGTLTTGRLGVSKVLPAEGVAMADLVRAAATAERHSNHPAARALRELAQGAGIPLAETSEFTEVPGRGVVARIDAVEVRVGRAAWLAEAGLAAPPPTDIEDGSSVVGVAMGGRFAGWISMQDQIRPGAAAALRDLESLGIRHLAMVTGDRAAVAETVSRRIGCPHVKADCLPGEKVAYVNEVKARGHRVAVVGDGVNDAPALAAGDTGIAMGAAGSDVAINSATMALMSNDLARIPFLVRLSRQSRAVILQNLGVGMIFIIAGWVLGGAGNLSPVGGAILHNIGSFVVLFNSARIVRAGDELEADEKPGREGGPA